MDVVLKCNRARIYPYIVRHCNICYNFFIYDFSYCRPNNIDHLHCQRRAIDAFRIAVRFARDCRPRYFCTLNELQTRVSLLDCSSLSRVLYQACQLNLIEPLITRTLMRSTHRRSQDFVWGCT